MDAESIVLAVAAGSLAVNGFFIRGAAKDLRALKGRVTQLEKDDAVQEWRLHHLERG